jgi:Fe2+ transport system protein FeoA
LTPAPSEADQRLDEALAAPVRVVAIEGDDPLSERLAAAGLWPGVVVERLASAPFGGPMLFRVQGYRLALRRSEAARVRVTASAGAAG